MKAVLLSQAPGVVILDITHAIAPQDIQDGAIILERAIRIMPAGTIHVAVVDPGVGSERRILLARINNQLVICPDNGLITWAWRRLGGGKAAELAWRPAGNISDTFHGRDIMAPAAARLAMGARPSTLGRVSVEPILLDLFPAEPGDREGVIVHIDHFGNATTNFPAEALAGLTIASIRVGQWVLGPVRKTYADAAPGQPLALIGSSGLMEIAVRNGSAAGDLRLRIGDRVSLQLTTDH